MTVPSDYKKYQSDVIVDLLQAYDFEYVHLLKQ